jgi:hypothetical protein
LVGLLQPLVPLFDSDLHYNCRNYYVMARTSRSLGNTILYKYVLGRTCILGRGDFVLVGWLQPLVPLFDQILESYMYRKIPISFVKNII